MVSVSGEIVVVRGLLGGPVSLEEVDLRDRKPSVETKVLVSTCRRCLKSLISSCVAVGAVGVWWQGGMDRGPDHAVVKGSSNVFSPF